MHRVVLQMHVWIGDLNRIEQLDGPVLCFRTIHAHALNKNFSDLPADFHNRIERCHGILKHDGDLSAQYFTHFPS